MPSDGYQTDLAEIHEHGYTHLARGAAAQLQVALADFSGDCRTVIDLGCGGGTLANLISQSGDHVIGYDISEAMIELARAKVPNGEFHVRSFIDVDFPSCVAVTAIGEIFNYLFDERNHPDILNTVWERIYYSLVPGGVLLFDMASSDRLHAAPPNSIANHEDYSVFVNITLDHNILIRKITSFRRVNEFFRRSIEEHKLRVVEPQTIVDQLTNIGFEVEWLDHYGAQKLPRGLHGFLARKMAQASA